MSRLANLFCEVTDPEEKDVHEHHVQELCEPIQMPSEKPHKQYENDVFSFLWRNKKPLGIAAVMKFTALLLDGAIDLVDGKRLGVEIKYRMNWEKACQRNGSSGMRRGDIWRSLAPCMVGL